MKLDKEQLRQISAFISKRGFTYYDVQLEIIDHVACKVEELMTADSTLTLDAAIQITHAKFGVMGFSLVEDAMRSSLQKRFWKLFRTTFVSYLSPVYLPLEGGLIYLIYRLVKVTNSVEILVDMAWLSTFLLIGIYVFLNYRSMKRYKRMLTVQMGGIVTLMFNIPMQLLIWLPRGSENVLTLNATAIVLGIVLTSVIIAFFALQKIQRIALHHCENLREQYQLTIGN